MMQQPTEKTSSADTPVLIEMVRGAALALEVNRDTINALNVFPVPDGDTGTNMLLTLRSVVDDLDRVSSGSIDHIATTMSRSALLAARGNSGLILAQFFRGLSEALDGKSVLDAGTLARSLRIAATRSYKVLPNPTEGTMLTVYRECAELAEQSAFDHSSLENVLSEVTAGSLDTVRRSPELLPVLAEAEVVDSGAFGFAVILDGALRTLTGEDPVGRVIEVPMPDGARFSGSVKVDFVDESEEIEWGYCTVFSIQNNDLNIDQIRLHMDRIGLSPIVDGASDVAKVHVHMEDPGEALTAGLKYGELSHVEIANMDKQTAGWASDRRDIATNSPPLEADAVSIAVVAVALGEGLNELIISTGLGATSVISGGDTMNPSVADLLAAVEAAPSDQVILLPNNKNIVPAAMQVDQMTKKDVRVVPAHSVQAGVAALLAFNLNLSLDENEEAMVEILDEVGEGKVCRASRDMSVDGHEIQNGMIFATFDEEIVASGHDPLLVLTELIENHSDGAEIVTVYTGEDVTPERSSAADTRLTETFGNIEIEIVRGGQPHYYYLVAIE